MDNIRAAANVAEIVDANATINRLKLQLAEANQQLKDWKINVDVEVQPSGSSYNIVIRTEAGGRIYQEALSTIDAQYFYDDKDTFIRLIADHVLVSLLRDRLVEKLTPKISKAIQNVHTLTKGFTQ